MNSPLSHLRFWVLKLETVQDRIAPSPQMKLRLWEADGVKAYCILNEDFNLADSSKYSWGNWCLERLFLSPDHWSDIWTCLISKPMLPDYSPALTSTGMFMEITASHIASPFCPFANLQAHGWLNHGTRLGRQKPVCRTVVLNLGCVLKWNEVFIRVPRPRPLIPELRRRVQGSAMS